MHSTRNYDNEHRDSSERQYAYNFDWVLRKYLLRTFAPFFKTPGSSMELGCYQGEMTSMLLDYFPQLTVVEASAELCTLVARRFPGKLDVLNATFESAKPNGHFDHIFLIHTLEHLDDAVGALARIKTWLAPDGHLFVAVPNANALSRQIAVKMGLVPFNTA